MLSSTCNKGPSSILNCMYKLYGKIPPFVKLGALAFLWPNVGGGMHIGPRADICMHSGMHDFMDAVRSAQAAWQITSSYISVAFWSIIITSFMYE